MYGISLHFKGCTVSGYNTIVYFSGRSTPIIATNTSEPSSAVTVDGKLCDTESQKETVGNAIEESHKGTAKKTSSIDYGQTESLTKPTIDVAQKESVDQKCSADKAQEESVDEKYPTDDAQKETVIEEVCNNNQSDEFVIVDAAEAAEKPEKNTFLCTSNSNHTLAVMKDGLDHFHTLSLESTKDGETGPSNTESTKDSKTGPLNTESTKDGETGPLNTESTKDGKVGPLNTESTKDGETGPLNTESTKDGKAGPLNTESTKDGETSPLNSESTKDGKASPLNTESTKDGETSPLNSESTKDGKTDGSNTESAKDGETVPLNTESAKDGETSPSNTELSVDGNIEHNKVDAVDSDGGGSYHSSKSFVDSSKNDDTTDGDNKNDVIIKDKDYDVITADSLLR